MYAHQLLCVLLFACQIILNRSFIIQRNSDSVQSQTTRPVALPEGYVVFPDVHAAYKLYREKVKWDVARDRCISEGAHLAIADSHKKVVHINSLKGGRGIEWVWIHVGIHKSNTTDDEYVRVDNGMSITSLPWLSRQGYPKGGYRNCVGISMAYDYLIDYDCYTEEHFACEIPT